MSKYNTQGELLKGYAYCRNSSCGCIFQIERGNQKYCSERCRKQAAMRRYRQQYRTLIHGTVYIHVDVYRAMLDAQNNACAICGVSFEKRSPRLDHNHTSGKIRAFLCHTCNIKLGFVEARVIEIGPFVVKTSSQLDIDNKFISRCLSYLRRYDG